MIKRAYVARHNGEPIFGRKYTSEEIEDDMQIPPSIRASIILLASARGTMLGSPYVIEQDDAIWVLCFFESFVVVLEADPNEKVDWLKRRALSLGRRILREFSFSVTAWPGEGSDIAGFADTIDLFARLNPAISVEKILKQVESTVNRVLVDYPVAYVGVFDAAGEMIGGNVPEDHIKIIRQEILGDSIRTSMDLVPTVVDVKGYEVHTIRVSMLTVVAAGYQEESKMAAVRAVGDLAQSIQNVLT